MRTRTAVIAVSLCIAIGGVLIGWDSRLSLTLKGHTDRVYDVAFSPDGKRLATVGGDLMLKVWDADNGQVLLSVFGSSPFGGQVAFSPDGKRLASSLWGGSRQPIPGVVKVWDATNGREVFALKGHTQLVTGLAFSPDGKRLASASADQTVKIWDVASGQQTFTLNGHTGAVSCVAFSPDGKRLASASHDSLIKLWDTTTGLETLTMKGHTRGLTSVSFSGDGKRMVSLGHALPYSPAEVVIWDVVSGQPKSLAPQAPDAWGMGNWMALSPDGARLAVADGSRTIRIWDATSGQQQLSLKGSIFGVEKVVFSHDGKRLAAVGPLDKTVRIWNVTP